MFIAPRNVSIQISITLHQLLHTVSPVRGLELGKCNLALNFSDFNKYRRYWL